jgi:hypothetical protein
MIYLHVKNGLMAATAIALLVYHWWRTDRSNRATLAWLLAPVAVLGSVYAVKIHQWYHTWIITAPFGNGQLFHFFPGLSIIASFLDIAKGLIPNNPAYLLIFAGLIPWWKRDRWSLAITLIVLLPSLLLQSTFNDWAGGYSPVGRYMMPTAIALLPAIAYFIDSLGSWIMWVGSILLLGVQALLAQMYITGHYQWNYAGEANPLFVYIRQMYHIRHNISSAVFGYSLSFGGRRASEILMLELATCLAMLAIGGFAAKGGPKVAIQTRRAIANRAITKTQPEHSS